MLSGDPPQALTTVPEQLRHLVLDQATEAMIAAKGSHCSGHILVFRVQRAKAEPGHPEVLWEEGTLGGGQLPTSATCFSTLYLPDTLKASQEPTLLAAHITWVLWASGSLQGAQHGGKGTQTCESSRM